MSIRLFPSEKQFRSKTNATADFANRHCGICDRARYRLHFRFNDRRILQCLECGIIFSDLIWDPEKVSRLYDNAEFFSGAYWGWDGKTALDERDAIAYRSALIAARTILGGTGRLLDVGCGLGGFLAEANLMGFTCEGNDLSEYAGTVIRQRLGMSIHLGELAALSLPSGRYDVISSWDTLEHVADPRALLLEMRRLVQPGSVLLLRTINEQTILTAVGSVLYSIGIPHAAARMHEAYHLYYFTRPLLFRLLTECGFRPVLRFDCEIDPERLGLPRVAQLAMHMIYRLQSVLDREFMQLIIAKAV